MPWGVFIKGVVSRAPSCPRCQSRRIAASRRRPDPWSRFLKLNMFRCHSCTAAFVTRLDPTSYPRRRITYIQTEHGMPEVALG